MTSPPMQAPGPKDLAELRHFADTAPAILWITDPQGACTFLSRSWYDYTGQSEAEALGLGWTLAVHPQDREAAGRRFMEANARREPFSLDYRLRRKDGTYRWAIDAGHPRLGPQGEFLGFVGSVIDVHERKLAEERARALVEATPECVKLVARDGTLLQMNASGLRMVGARSADAVVGKCIYDVIAPQDRERFREFNERVCRGESATLEFDIVGLDGRRRHMDTHAVPLAQPDGSYAQLAVTRDVTHRRATSRALESSEARYRAVVENLSEMVCRFRPDGEILFVNGAYARAVGRRPEELLGTSFWDLIPQEEHAAVRGMLARLTPAAPEVRIENRFTTSAGERWTLWTNRALAFDAAGQVAEAQSTGIDITERRAAEAALKEADRRKDEFLAILSHELRNPLAPIRSAVTLLRMASGDPKAVGETLPVLERQVAHLVRLVDDLLDVSRISRGDIVLQKRAVTLAEVVSAALEASRPLVAAQGHRLELDMPKPAPVVLGDPVRLAQVVGNLVNNAASYTPQGGRIEVSARAEGAQAVIRVRDNGPGIPPHAARHMFELFARGENASSHASGFGIGLALSKRIVEMHDGTIEAATPASGRGSELVVRLPLARAAEPAAAAAPPRASASASGKRVLVVDDNVDAAHSLGMVLSALGAQVRVLNDGRQALEQFAGADPDVVLLDIGMPGMDGYEVARAIRERFPGHRAALVALTGWGQDEDRRRATDAGFDHHLVKPAEMAALEEILGVERTA